MMEHNFVREVCATRLFDERATRVFVQERGDTKRTRKRRERVARFLKALACRLAPPTARVERPISAAMTLP